MQVIINKSQKKIIEKILREPGINVREIIRKTSLSPNYVLACVNYLKERGILKEEQLKKGKRVYLRRFYFNFNLNIGKNYFSIIEDEKKEEFFLKYPSLKSVLKHFVEELSQKKINFILIFGSYARFTAEKESDIDILIVGDIKEKENIREVFVSLPIEVSIKVESLKDFKKRLKDILHQQIINDHILLYDCGDFVNLLTNFSHRKD
ncbi:nucleotidyltransferase domain-containing protein [Candidatus Pacearchaeota archaeon]|nr:nucleotidyltransferase domain-containing protein [Candidatus Pacearchaeota archaeon]